MVSNYQQQQRKRDHEGVLKHKKHVYVPFRINVPAGQSTFTIPVPKLFQNRLFFFSYLALVPDFYSDQAQAMDLDTDTELEEIINFEISIKNAYRSSTELYPLPYIPSQVNPNNVIGLATSINSFFHVRKPTGTFHLGFFIDWIDTRFYNPNITMSWDQYVQMMSMTFYGEDYNESKFFNILPPSARTVPGANNYLFPTQMTPDLLKFIRFRFNIAPNVIVSFPNERQLYRFGFTLEQIGDVNVHQIRFRNENDNQFLMLEAIGPSDLITPIIQTFNVRLYLREKNFYSDLYTINMKKKFIFDNEQFEIVVKNVLKLIAESCNLIVDLNYKKDEEKFEFLFPENAIFDELTIVLDYALSERLGFKMVENITKLNSLGDKVGGLPDTKHIQEKARALAYDTSVVIVTDDNTGSNSTYGVDEQFMAALYPTSTGSLEIPASELCYEPPTMELPTILTGKSSFILTTFRLNRFLDNNMLAKLVWKNGAFVYGVLRGERKPFDN